MDKPVMTIGRPGARVVKFSASSTVKIIAPVWGAGRYQLMHRWEQAAQARPDVIEWRADRSEVAPNDPLFTDLEAYAAKCRDLYGIAVMATYRSTEDDPAHSTLSRQSDQYPQVLLQMAQWADVVDIEAAHPQSELLVSQVKKRGAAALLSRHLDHVLPLADLQNLAQEAHQQGANGLKVACLVSSDEDLQLLHQAQHWAVTAPLPTAVFGMGELAAPTRLSQEAKDAPFAFAVPRGLSTSAVGQPTIEQLRSSL